MWKTQEHNNVRVIANDDVLADNNALEQALIDLEKCIAENTSARWIIDGSCIGVINSEAIATLIRIVRQVNLGHGRISLAKINQFVAGVLQSLRIAKVFPIYQTLDQAIKDFS